MKSLFFTIVAALSLISVSGFAAEVESSVSVGIKFDSRLANSVYSNNLDDFVDNSPQFGHSMHNGVGRRLNDKLKLSFNFHDTTGQTMLESAAASGSKEVFNDILGIPEMRNILNKTDKKGRKIGDVVLEFAMSNPIRKNSEIIDSLLQKGFQITPEAFARVLDNGDFDLATYILMTTDVTASSPVRDSRIRIDNVNVLNFAESDYFSKADAVYLVSGFEDYSNKTTRPAPYPKTFLSLAKQHHPDLTDVEAFDQELGDFARKADKKLAVENLKQEIYRMNPGAGPNFVDVLEHYPFDYILDELSESSIPVGLSDARQLERALFWGKLTDFIEAQPAAEGKKFAERVRPALLRTFVGTTKVARKIDKMLGKYHAVLAVENNAELLKGE